MRFLRSAPAHQAIAQINVTPLIDVMLCLLVVFLISAPVLAQRISLDLPQPNRETPQKPLEPLKLRVLAGGQVALGQQLLAAAELEPALAAEWRQAPERGLALAVEPSAPFDALAQVLGSARNVGFQKIGFVPSEGASGP